MKTKEKRSRTELGARLMEFRKASELSQAELANLLGIPQRTLAFYELDAEHIPSTILPKLASFLNVSIEAILGMKDPESKKRGPKSQLEKQIENIATLPKNEQLKILSVVEAFINQNKTG